MSIAIQSITGKTVGDNFNQLIAAAIGVAPIAWSKYDIYSFASSGASIPTRDLARVGYLMMMNGAWGSGQGEQQVLSASSAAYLHQTPPFLASTVPTPTPGSPFAVQSDAPQYYGSFWWTNRTGAALGSPVPTDAYYAWGYRETFLVVVPSLDMIVVRYGYPPLAQAGYGAQLMARVMNAVVPASSGGQSVASLSLINADTNQPISRLRPAAQRHDARSRDAADAQPQHPRQHQPGHSRQRALRPRRQQQLSHRDGATLCPGGR